MSIFALGLNHKTASVNLREKVYFSLDKLTFYLQDLLACNIVQEAVLLSTCNRSELYCEAEDSEQVKAWFCKQTTLSAIEVEKALYIYRDEVAIAHMMQVACGIDSMILGESQILGQMKASFSESCTVGAVSNLFHRLFQQIFTVAKDIRTTTTIGACPVSVASAAVHFAKEHCQHFNNANVMIIGAGETTSLLLKYLNQYLQKPVTIVNRSAEKVTPLMAEFGGNYISLDNLPEALCGADVVFSATGSPVPLINKKLLVENKLLTRSLMLIDVAVPRDIDASVGELENITLYCIDDLKNRIALNRHGREHAAVKAIEMIQEKSKICLDEIYSIDKVAHTIRAYRGQIESMCHAELQKAKQQLLLGAQADKVLDDFSRAFMNKLMHTPSVQLRKASVEGRYDLLRLAKQLFAIPDPDLEVEPT